jgi:hypothetical protein
VNILADSSVRVAGVVVVQQAVMLMIAAVAA